LAFLNAGEALITLSTLVDIVHFAEAGYCDEEVAVEVAFVEGSISTPQELVRIHKVRESCNYLVTIGACATAGGLQALRNMHDHRQWVEGIYAQPQTIELLADSTPVAEHVKVDLELWGCPVSGRQVLDAVRSLLFGVLPREEQDKVCLECKRRQAVCVLVAKGEPCMGPVTRTGCGAICPRFGRDCYACYEPSEQANSAALANRFEGLGLQPDDIARRFLFINSHVEPFNGEGRKWRGKG
jgi:coenzyme F420-reducing hydrogenase gamma subunit